MDHFYRFSLTIVHSKWKRSSLRSQRWMKLFLWFSYTVTMLKKRSFLDWFLNNVSALQIGMYNFSQTVLFSFLGGPFRQVGGLCHGCLRSWARAPRCSELYAQCQLSIFFFDCTKLCHQQLQICILSQVQRQLFFAAAAAFSVNSQLWSWKPSKMVMVTLWRWTKNVWKTMTQKKKE